ncbi:outer membrane protein assembly factor BamC [Candidatus Methylopumilus planktonicus]|uniref:outer membrane protein assembly factor BamC n=1 Tax=Candidatus Methylopumilus planktonicus TaxID=1581557 RepID=UPI0011226C3A|nr:outer membrane protein assembly factor BamC [Candidatus Methylopumilus planktonicus]QDD07284.1 outer membrane protein assembly factor BamC [Candidatus Methylopumilus planktonicus]QDD08613.1 outer membrane protein assembly factor BamC [Candidatus Methylopumilus planktonicus]QDD09936.1 outer membrane protein assembly factor BamC [Candidatus Methylopumilus planktonicus]
MKLLAQSKWFYALPLFLLLNGCENIPFVERVTAPDYKATGRSRPLEVPPDLTSATTNDAYAIPGSTSYSDFKNGQQQDNGQPKILPNPEGMKIVKAGAQRWLVVNAPAEKIWPLIRDFWIDMGFAVKKENPEVGVMETEWIKEGDLMTNDNKGTLDKFDAWLDSLTSGTANRKKFRTRLERGLQDGTTEIYMTHRSVDTAPDDGKEKIRTPYGVVDMGYKNDSKSKEDSKVDSRSDELDAELLRRLMVKLGLADKRAKEIIAAPISQKRAEIKKEADGSSSVEIQDPFDRAWRRVGLALDIIGFVIEDKDRSNGIYFVKYADVDIDDSPKKKKGVLDSLMFWSDDDKKDKQAKDTSQIKEKPLSERLKFWGGSDKEKTNPEKQYRIKIVSIDNGGSQVVIEYQDGKKNTSSTANRIISLLYDQLK